MTDPEMASIDSQMPNPSSNQGMRVAIMLGDSRSIGVLISLLPLFLTILSVPVIYDLAERELVSWGLTYGPPIMFIIEMIFLSGCVVFWRDLRIGRLDFGARGFFTFLLFMSIAPVVILASVELFGAYPIEIAWLEALGVLAFLIWLMYFGWLRELSPDQWKRE